MKKILVVQPNMKPPGGGNAVAVRILEACTGIHNITLLTGEPIDFAAVDAFYGSALQTAPIRVLTPPRLLWRLTKLERDPFSFQGPCLLMRMAKLIGRNYDLLIYGNDEADLGRPAIQYVHYPWLGQKYKTSLEWSPLRRALRLTLRPWRLISGFSFERMKQNLTLVNSQWTRERFYEYYQTPATVLYPPVADDVPPRPWEEREQGFLCIGRISPEKRLGRTIQILKAVRETGHDLHLHIIGTVGSAPFERDYFAVIDALVRENAEWISWHLDLPRADLVRMIAGHRYGIHGMEDEHFGIAVAEMIKGGCILFAPAFAGPVEITGGDERFLYTDAEQAVEKIRRTLASPSLQQTMREHLKERGALFAESRFKRAIQQIIAEQLNRE
jgi:glycosyltransferase involved in cell wall biosynthesis